MMYNIKDKQTTHTEKTVGYHIMQVIQITDNMTAKELFQVCLDNGVKFSGMRAKIAKRLYIQAIEKFNSEIIAPVVEKVAEVVTSDTVEAMVEATEISTDRFIIPLVEAILIIAVVTIDSTITAVQWARDNDVLGKAYRAFLIAITFTIIAGQRSGEYYRSIVNDDHPALALLTDVVRAIPIIVPEIERVTQAIAPVVGVTLLTIAIGLPMVIIQPLKAIDWSGYTTRFKAWVHGQRAILVANGDDWHERDAARG